MSTDRRDYGPPGPSRLPVVLDRHPDLLQDLAHVSQVSGYLRLPTISEYPEIEVIVKPLQPDRESSISEDY